MIVEIKNLHVGGMAIFPFIFIKSSIKEERKIYLINHERIHLRQQVELLFIPFYFLYLLFYFINLVKYRNHDIAYRNIIFEREAFAHERDLEYLNKRRFWSFLE